jgi:hypothetical protein
MICQKTREEGITSHGAFIAPRYDGMVAQAAEDETL